jgi:hypothetical protein
MTLGTKLRRLWFDVHGIAISVHADDERVLDAIELRFLDFTPKIHSEVEIEISFLTSDFDAVTAPPRARSRPVYETPYGPLRYFPAEDALCGELGGVRLRCDPTIGLAAMQCQAFEDRALYLATHPLTTVCLMELLERRGLYSLHAACLANDAGSGVLLAGQSGAGKSTLALALARAGFAFLGDDVVFLRREADQIRALGFADAIGLTSPAGEESGGQPDANGGPDAGFPKRLERIERLWPGLVLETVLPSVILFPRVVADAPSRISPLESSEALLRIVPDVLLTQPRSTQGHLAAFAALLDQVRCYEYVSGHDLERSAELVRSVLDASSA